MANWRLAKSLIQLRDQINTLYPSRSKVSDGSIGDAAHAAKGDASDHNPWVKDSKGIGVVTAIDVTNDPAHGLNGSDLANKLINDVRTKYVIFTGKIWKSRTGKWEPYKGQNAHNHHVHVSVMPFAADNTAAWVLDGEQAREILKLGSKGEAVRELQTKLKAWAYVNLHIVADGVFGPVTETSVRHFQRSKGMAETGQVDAATWEALGQ